METVFTSITTRLYVNDKPLGFVQSIDIEDTLVNNEKYTDITLCRIANDCDDVINDMRMAPFIFKMTNTFWMPNPLQAREEIGGYYAPEAEVISFKMSLKVKPPESENDILQQIIVIRAKSFTYVKDIGLDGTRTIEEEDLKNLIKILKKNQEAAKRPESGFIKYGVPGNKPPVPPAVLPINDDGQPELIDDCFVCHTETPKSDLKKKKKGKKNK